VCRCVQPASTACCLGLALMQGPAAAATSQAAPAALFWQSCWWLLLLLLMLALLAHAPDVRWHASTPADLYVLHLARACVIVTLGCWLVAAAMLLCSVSQPPVPPAVVLLLPILLPLAR
jgi:hypothetical protein